MKEVAVFGGGCFWCTEAVFQQLKGVTSVTSGYAGGKLKNPTYWDLHSDDTGHAEVIKVEYDKSQISYHDLLTVFFGTHDPTQVNRQGYDVGTEYRSLILTTSKDQRSKAEKYIAELKANGLGVATEVAALEAFYPAESYHQDYYESNKSAPYCQLIIDPKLQKLQEKFADLLKNQTK